LTCPVYFRKKTTAELARRHEGSKDVFGRTGSVTEKAAGKAKTTVMPRGMAEDLQRGGTSAQRSGTSRQADAIPEEGSRGDLDGFVPRGSILTGPIYAIQTLPHNN